MYALQQLIADYQNNNQFSGQLAVAKEGNIIYRYSDGYADLTLQRPFANKQVFPIAAITKQFMAAMILKLCEDGKLELDQPIITYLPANHEIWDGHVPKWATEITLHHLLSNSSGLVNYIMEAIFDPKYWRSINDSDGHNVARCILNKVKDSPLLFTPGSEFGYCDTNYLLLDLIARQLIGVDLHDWFRINVFNQFAMHDTTWPKLSDELAYIRDIYCNESLPKRYTAMYRDVKSTPYLEFDHGFNVPCAGAGGMFSTLEDLLIWNEVLHNEKFINAKSLQLMRDIHIGSKDSYLGTVSYGYGLMVDYIGEYAIYSHSGHFKGIRTHLSYDVQNKISIVILANLGPSYEQDFATVEAQDREQLNLVTQLHREIIKSGI